MDPIKKRIISERFSNRRLWSSNLWLIWPLSLLNAPHRPQNPWNSDWKSLKTSLFSGKFCSRGKETGQCQQDLQGSISFLGRSFRATAHKQKQAWPASHTDTFYPGVFVDTQRGRSFPSLFLFGPVPENSAPSFALEGQCVYDLKSLFSLGCLYASGHTQQYAKTVFARRSGHNKHVEIMSNNRFHTLWNHRWNVYVGVAEIVVLQKLHMRSVYAK